MNIIKRSGKEEPFNIEKIENAINKCKTEASSHGIPTPSEETIKHITGNVLERCKQLGRAAGVEEIQDMVEEELIDQGFARMMKLYADYRSERALRRVGNTTDAELESLLARQNEEAIQENANKNPKVNSTLRDYMAGTVSKDWCRRKVFSDEVMKAHDEGIIHIHDLDYVAMPMFNCQLINLEDMFKNGTVINKTLIETPHSFATACNIATQIVAQVASGQYGGQTFSLAHLSPFIDVSRKRIREEVIKELDSIQDGWAVGNPFTERDYDKITERRLALEVKRGVQTIQYQINTLLTSNGQTPFVSVNMDIHEQPEGPEREDLAMLIEEVLNQRIEGVKNEVGVWITPAFPKLLYFLNEDNAYEGSKYFYLTELAAKCTAKRMVPDYMSEKVMEKLKGGDHYPTMGCRSILTPDPVNHQYYGRFNQGVVTLNLVYTACASDGDMEKFWKLLDEHSELVHKALRTKHEQLRGVPSDVSPIHWQYGAVARLKKGETIDHLLYNNYSTISYGYCGLAEMCQRMLGCSHTTEKGFEFAKSVMEFMNAKCAKWRAEENISYSIYGTPLETVTYRFAKCLQKRFGKIPNVTDRMYVTNSYHVHVTEEIDAFTKLSFESKLQELSPGGAISYVEVPNLQDNIPAVIAVIQHIYENIMYAELNTKSDYCQVCGFDGEINIIEDENGKLDWECPRCGNRDHDKMNVCRRTCGYLGTNFFNQGRTAEIKDRVMHL